jgi:hypothetical protein
MDITLVLVTLLSLTLAAVMTMLAWRIAREERRRSDARVAALAAEIHDARGPRGSTGAARPELVERRADGESALAARVTAVAHAPRAVMPDLPLRDGPTAPLIMSSDLFGAAQPAQARSHFAAVFAVGVLVVGSTIAIAVALSGSKPAEPAVSRPAQTTGVPATVHAASPAAAPAPLELVALTHERQADRLTVRGVVRNPSSGADVARLTAVVFLFNRDGNFLASGRAGVDAAALPPGTEAPFAVTIPGAANVGRYRVSFRTDDRVVPHVDRRDRAMAQVR